MTISKFSSVPWYLPMLMTNHPRVMTQLIQYRKTIVKNGFCHRATITNSPLLLIQRAYKIMYYI